MLELPVDVAPSKMDLSTARKTIYAFAGKPVDIVLRCANSVIGGVVDQFGSGVKIETRSDGHFHARVKAAPQGVLYWTMQYLGEVEILEPAEMRKSAIEMIKSNPYGV